MAIIQAQELIEAGVHFGHRASRWNPKMRPFIYGKRNLIHIVDLRETVRGLLRAYKFLAKVASRGSLVLFVGTKRQAKEAIEREATRCGMPYVNERWLGGTLTNYRTIRDRLKRLQELEAMWLPHGEKPQNVDMIAYMKTMLNESGKLELHKAPDNASIRTYSKKMVSQLNRELTKITRNLSGIREMNRLPDAMVIIDPKREEIAIKEAQRMGVTTVALIDTDSDPDLIDLPIPGNDDSIRSIELILKKLADAVLEGKASLPPEQQQQGRGRQARTRGRRRLSLSRDLDTRLRYIIALSVAVLVIAGAVLFTWMTFRSFENEIRQTLRQQKQAGTLPPEMEGVDIESVNPDASKVMVTHGIAVRLQAAQMLAKLWFLWVPLVLAASFGVAWQIRK